MANLAETCGQDSLFQLIIKILVAPNSMDNGKFLLQTLSNLVERTDLGTLYAD